MSAPPLLFIQLLAAPTEIAGGPGEEGGGGKRRRERDERVGKVTSVKVGQIFPFFFSSYQPTPLSGRLLMFSAGRILCLDLVGASGLRGEMEGGEEEEEDRTQGGGAGLEGEEEEEAQSGWGVNLAWAATAAASQPIEEQPSERSHYHRRPPAASHVACFFSLSFFSFFHRWISFFHSSQAAIGFTSSPLTIENPPT